MDNIVLLVVLPLLAAFLMPVVARSSEVLARTLGLSVLFISIAIILNVWNQSGQIDSQAVSIAIGGFLPPLGINFYVDQISLFFALAVPVMVLLFWPWNRSTSIREYSLMMLLTASASGLILSGDLFNIYVFYELLAIASYSLVAIQGRAAAVAASFRYLLMGSVGSVMMLLGIAIIYTQTGTLNLAHLSLLAPEKLNNILGLGSFALILTGMGVKAELFPVNSWVPEVYGSVSSNLAALMAGLLSKLAVIVIVRLLILLFPQPEALQLMAVLGIMGVITGELVAWRAKDFVRMLSFSSIGQLGLVFLAFSIPGEMGMMAGIAIVLHHMVVKPALFMLATGWRGSLENLSGVARRSPFAVLLFIVLILSLLGIPPLPGFWAKYLLMVGLSSQDGSIYTLGMFIVPVAMIIEIAYLFRLVMIMYRKEGDEAAVNNPDIKVAPQSHSKWGLAIAASVAAMLIAIVLQLQPASDKLVSLASQLSDRNQYISTVFPQIHTVRMQSIK